MPDIVLLLGPVAFQDFEIPSGINFGGRQRLALHRLPGGARIIDALGRDDAEISFSGIFSGSDATLRARSLDEMRADGMTFPLMWDVFFYTVLISDFHADYRNGWWIPYRITCTVLRDEASSLIGQVVSLAASALSDIGAASGYAGDAGIDLSSLQTALGAPDATVRGTAAYSATQSSLGDGLSVVDGSIDAANARLATVDPAGAGSSTDGAARLIDATDAAGQLSSLTCASSYIRRATINLTNAST
jgi:hypothetical protein